MRAPECEQRSRRATSRTHFRFPSPARINFPSPCALGSNVGIRIGWGGKRPITHPPHIRLRGWTRTMQLRAFCFAAPVREKSSASANKVLMCGLIKGLTVFATFDLLERMRLTFVFAALILFVATGVAPAQEKRSWLGRALHPFGSSRKNPGISQSENSRPCSDRGPPFRGGEADGNAPAAGSLGPPDQSRRSTQSSWIFQPSNESRFCSTTRPDAS